MVLDDLSRGFRQATLDIPLVAGEVGRVTGKMLHPKRSAARAGDPPALDNLDIIAGTTYA